MSKNVTETSRVTELEFKILQHKHTALLEQVEKLVELLDNAKDTVSTHAMQTYSRVSAKKAEEIEQALAEYEAWKKEQGL